MSDKAMQLACDIIKAYSRDNANAPMIAALIDAAIAQAVAEATGELRDKISHYKWHADNFAAILQKLGSYASGWRKPYLVSEIERFKADVAMPYLHAESALAASTAPASGRVG